MALPKVHVTCAICSTPLIRSAGQHAANKTGQFFCPDHSNKKRAAVKHLWVVGDWFKSRDEIWTCDEVSEIDATLVGTREGKRDVFFKNEVTWVAKW